MSRISQDVVLHHLGLPLRCFAYIGGFRALLVTFARWRRQSRSERRHRLPPESQVSSEKFGKISYITAKVPGPPGLDGLRHPVTVLGVVDLEPLRKDLALVGCRGKVPIPPGRPANDSTRKWRIIIISSLCLSAQSVFCRLSHLRNRCLLHAWRLASDHQRRLHGTTFQAFVT